MKFRGVTVLFPKWIESAPPRISRRPKSPHLLGLRPKGTCYWVWNLCDKILACMKKDPSCFRKHPEQCFLRPDLKFFLEFQKKFWLAKSVNLKMTIQNYFFVKKVCRKKSKIKNVGNLVTRKEHIRAHPNEYEIYVEKYFLVWKKTQDATANNRNNVF